MNLTRQKSACIAALMLAFLLAACAAAIEFFGLADRALGQNVPEAAKIVSLDRIERDARDLKGRTPSRSKGAAEVEGAVHERGSGGRHPASSEVDWAGGQPVPVGAAWPRSRAAMCAGDR